MIQIVNVKMDFMILQIKGYLTANVLYTLL